VFAKATVVIFCMLWFRATFPRLRFDHLVGFAWKFLVPLTLVNLMLAALVVKLANGAWAQAGLMLLGNIILVAVTFWIVNRSARKLEDAPALKHIAAAER
jgi:lipopolysaccharide export LptBFGC system permease protein LptF